MRTICKEFTAQTGQRMIGLGSWIQGDYKPGVSDHDIRLLMPSGTADAEATRAWQQSRQTLRNMIREEFGTRADDVLGRTNLYPPSQLVRTVEDSADAARAFERLRSVPALSHVGQVTPKTAARYSEGLWGRGAKVWTQNYEATSGRLFYSRAGKGFTGMTDLTHLLEGRGRYSASGMANTTVGWIEHAAHEVGERNAERIAKYLNRIDGDLMKARDMARAGADAPFRAEIQSLIKELELTGASVAANEKRIAAVLRRSRLEAAVLKRFDDAGPVQREVLDAMIKGIRGKDRLGEILSEAADKIPADKLIHGMVIGLIVHQSSKTAGEESLTKALAKALPEVASLPAGLMVELTDTCLKEAKLAGGTMVANRQEAWDLVEGMHTAQGREKGFGATAKMEYTFDQLVANIHDESRLKSFVMARAAQAADRDGGAALDAGDRHAADAIFTRCYPTILQAWLARRALLRREYIRLVGQLRATPIVITYAPCPAILPEGDRPLPIRLQVEFPEADLGEILPRMNELLSLLAGRDTFALMYVTFAAKGQEGGSQMEKIVYCREAKTYTTKAKVRFSAGRAGSLGENEFLRLDLTRNVEVDVEVLPPGQELGKSPQFPFKPTHIGLQFDLQSKVHLRGHNDYGTEPADFDVRKTRTLDSAVDSGIIPITLTAAGFTGRYDFKKAKGSLTVRGTFSKDGKSIASLTIEETQGSDLEMPVGGSTARGKSTRQLNLTLPNAAMAIAGEPSERKVAFSAKIDSESAKLSYVVRETLSDEISVYDPEQNRSVVVKREKSVAVDAISLLGGTVSIQFHPKAMRILGPESDP